MVEKGARRRPRRARQHRVLARRRDRPRVRGRSFDGALTRFSLHHIPVPATGARGDGPGGAARRPGRSSATTSATRTPRRRLARGDRAPPRPPSHWASLTAGAPRALGEAPASSSTEDSWMPFELPFAGWLRPRLRRPRPRHQLIDRLLEEPAGDRRPLPGRGEADAAGCCSAPLAQAPPLIRPELAQGEDREGVRPGERRGRAGTPVRGVDPLGQSPAGVAARRRSPRGRSAWRRRRARRSSRPSRRSVRSRDPPARPALAGVIP